MTMLAAKLGLALTPASQHGGDIIVADLGVDQVAVEAFMDAPEMYVDQEYALQLPLPAFDTNKYDRGRALIIAGSRDYSGAALMAVLAATRSGAGYVTLATPESVAGFARAHLLTAPVVALPETTDGRIAPRALTRLLELSASHDAILLGPGLGRSPRMTTLVKSLVADNRSEMAVKPLVLDADALNAYENSVSELLNVSWRPLVLTPHAGELGRLLGHKIERSQALAQALPLVRSLTSPALTTVFKGPSTLIAAAGRVIVDAQGPSTLATAGTGDVLAGITVALLAQGLAPQVGAALAVRLQAHAAILATEDLTPLSVTAVDVIENIPDASRALLQSLHQQRRP